VTQAIVGNSHKKREKKEKRGDHGVVKGERGER